MPPVHGTPQQTANKTPAAQKPAGPPAKATAPATAGKKPGVPKVDEAALAAYLKKAKRSQPKLTPADAERFSRLALTLLKQGDLAGSAAAAELATRANPQSRDAWVVYGSAHAKAKQFKPAEQGYKRALALDPKHLSSWTALGEIYLSQHQFKQATVALKQACMLDPECKHPAGVRARALIGRAIATLR